MEQLVYTQALALAGALPQYQQKLLEVLCAGAVGAVKRWIREDVDPSGCQEDLVAAASLLALAGLEESRGGIQEFRAGDLTVKPGGGGAGQGLKKQAMLRLKPYLRDGFAFLGV